MNSKKVITLKTFFILIIIFLVLRMSSADAGIQMNSHDMTKEGYVPDKSVAVHYVITDPQGRRLGYDPLTDKYFNDSIGGYGDVGVPETSMEVLMQGLADGNYLIEIIGDRFTGFSFNISILRNIVGEGFTDIELEGVIDKGLTSKFQFTYNSDPTKPAGIATRIATPSNLKQDIALSRKIGWIDNDGIMNSLLKKAEAIEASITKGNKTAAKNQLNAFINEVNAQKGKHISDKAVKILLEDAQYILDNLNDSVKSFL